MPKTEPPGATNRIVAAEFLRRRRLLGLSQSQIAERFSAAGYEVKLAAYSAIEAGKTRITVDMLTVAAHVFGCAPTSLMISYASAEADPVQYQGSPTVTAAQALDWMRMEAPLPGPDAAEPGLATLLRWQTDSFPGFAVPPMARPNNE